MFLLPYKLGIRKRRRLPCPVISIGNITFGGTGKTPTVRTIAAELMSRGLKPVILSRGHAGRTKSSSAIVSDGITRLMSAEECGDEPAMLADLLPGCPVVIGKDRRRSGALALGHFNPDVILLDDALQYWQLHRDMDVVLVNAAEPFGYGHVMPRGALREPLSGLRRAGIVVITNSDRVSVDELASIKDRISALAPAAKIVEAIHQPTKLRTLKAESRGLDWLTERRVCTMCSIGVPGLFRDSVAALGAEVLQDFSFPDHHFWQSEEVAAIAEEASAAGAEALITTEKDAVKLPSREWRLPILTLDITMDFGQCDLPRALLNVVTEFGTNR